MKNRKKGISRYTVMFIPDTSDNAKSYELTFDTLSRWIVGIVAVVAVIICLFISIIIKSNEAIYGENGYVDQIEKLSVENEELRKQVEKKVEEEGKESEGEKGSEEDQKNDIPRMLPIEGNATLIKDPTKLSSEYPYRLVFLALPESKVIASADGIVKEIYEYEEEENEFSHAVLLDHKNGYESVYLISGDPLITVQAGRMVDKGEELARLSDNETIVG